MIGAIIGDIAAWTYEHDREAFWNQLISYDDKVSLSEFGRAYLQAASWNLSALSNRETYTLDITDYSPTDLLSVTGQWLMWQLMSAWNDNLDYPKGLNYAPYTDKEEFYARLFVVDIIRGLRQGKTKSEVFHSVESFESIIKSWKCKWKPLDGISTNKVFNGLLIYVFRAWDSFYRGFDFTSSIHNAMKWGGDRHLIAMLTASFASAMYGCQFNIIKKKFVKGNEILHGFNILDLIKRLKYDSSVFWAMYDRDNKFRSFYPKNNALTNVEWHHWQSVLNLFDRISFTKEEHRLILRCSPTGWDNRYGLYLDDGWMYVYRSKCLIGRFKLKHEGENWMITDTQLSGERSWKDFCQALSCALTESCGLRKIKGIYEADSYASLCKYYQGEDKCPDQWKDDVKGRFWYGEMMFCKEHIDIEYWRQYVEKIMKSLSKDKKELAQKLSTYQFGMVLYIETLFCKWRPYDDMKWILGY